MSWAQITLSRLAISVWQREDRDTEPIRATLRDPRAASRAPSPWG